MLKLMLLLMRIQLPPIKRAGKTGVGAAAVSIVSYYYPSPSTSNHDVNELLLLVLLVAHDINFMLQAD